MELATEAPRRRPKALGLAAFTVGLLSLALLCSSIAWAHHWSLRADALVAGWAASTVGALVLSSLGLRGDHGAKGFAGYGLLFGILISSSAGNLIGRTSLSFAANLISANAVNGVEIAGAGSDANTVAGDRIGTSASGAAALGNFLNGVAVASGSGNVVGSDLPGDTLLSGNGGGGVLITGSATGTTVHNCTVGTNSAGSAALPNAD